MQNKLLSNYIQGMNTVTSTTSLVEESRFDTHALSLTNNDLFGDELTRIRIV